MRYTIIVLLIATLLFATGFSRNMKMSFDGDIEYTSQHGSPVAESVVQVSGSGSGTITQEASGSEDSFSHKATAEFESVDVTMGLLAPQGVYITRVAPEPGESGVIEQAAELSNNEFAQLRYGHEAQITYGEYQRRIEMANQDGYVKEVLDLFGAGWTRDLLQFGIEDE